MQETQIGPHIPDNKLSEYALGRLRIDEVPVVFEHLLACEECNQRYEEELDFRLTMREAAARPDTQPEPVRKFNWVNIFAVPKPAWAAMAALALLVVFVPMMRKPEGPAQLVTVTALRGGDEVMAKSGSPIQLRLEMTALDVPEPVKVQIVDRDGSEIWDGTASKTNSWQVDVGRLDQGTYWVRVSDPANPSELLREFRLLVN